MRDLIELNLNEGGAPVGRAPPTDAEVAAFEARYQIRVPVGLREFLRYSNGGHPEVNSILVEKARWAINRFHFLGAEEVPGSLGYAVVHWAPILGADALPFAGDGGGNQFFIDLGDGTIHLCLHDEGMRRVYLAHSFDEFIDRLDVDEDMI